MGTILHCAAVLGSPELFEMILKLIDSKVLKLNVNAVDMSGETALKILAGHYFRGTYEQNIGDWRYRWTFTKDESYQCIKIMLSYAEKLGINVNKICKHCQS